MGVVLYMRSASSLASIGLRGALKTHTRLRCGVSYNTHTAVSAPCAYSVLFPLARRNYSCTAVGIPVRPMIHNACFPCFPDTEYIFLPSMRRAVQRFVRQHDENEASSSTKPTSVEMASSKPRNVSSPERASTKLTSSPQPRARLARRVRILRLTSRTRTPGSCRMGAAGYCAIGGALLLVFSFGGAIARATTEPREPAGAPSPSRSTAPTLPSSSPLPPCTMASPAAPPPLLPPPPLLSLPPLPPRPPRPPQPPQPPQPPWLPPAPPPSAPPPPPPALPPPLSPSPASPHPAPPPISVVDDVNRRFWHGGAYDSLDEAGVLVRECICCAFPRRLSSTYEHSLPHGVAFARDSPHASGRMALAHI